MAMIGTIFRFLGRSGKTNNPSGNPLVKDLIPRTLFIILPERPMVLMAR